MRHKVERALSEPAYNYLQGALIRSKKQRERLILELYDQDKTVREIAREVHMSFRDIGTVTKMATQESDIDSTEPQLKRNNISKESQALELFLQGKQPIEVAVVLDLKPYKVERLYKDYSRLLGLQELASLYDEIKHCLPSFIRLYRTLKRERRLSTDEIENILRYSKDIPWLSIRYHNLLADVEDLENKKIVYLKELQTFQDTISDLNCFTEQAKTDLYNKQLQIDYLDKQLMAICRESSSSP